MKIEDLKKLGLAVYFANAEENCILVGGTTNGHERMILQDGEIIAEKLKLLTETDNGVLLADEEKTYFLTKNRKAPLIIDTTYVFGLCFILPDESFLGIEKGTCITLHIGKDNRVCETNVTDLLDHRKEDMKVTFAKDDFILVESEKCKRSFSYFANQKSFSCYYTSGFSELKNGQLYASGTIRAPFYALIDVDKRTTSVFEDVGYALGEAWNGSLTTVEKEGKVGVYSLIDQTIIIEPTYELCSFENDLIRMTTFEGVTHWFDSRLERVYPFT